MTALVLGVRGKRAFAIGASCFAFGLGFSPGRVELVRTASAQTEADLAAARRLFAEGLTDEQAGRHAAALEKFTRVQAVRDTQAVRYRIATCLEALGRLRAALEAYTATSVAASTDAESASIARASREKVEALGRRVARLIVTLPSPTPADALVKVDDEPIAANAIGTPIVVNPGAHEITASASNAAPFRAQITLAEGAQSTVQAALAARQPPAPEPPPRPASVVTLAPPPPPIVPTSQGESEPSPPPSRSGRTATGVVFLTAGGVLLAGASAVLLVRHSDIQTLEAQCPNGVCPVSQESSIEATRNRALVEGPVGVGVGAAGLVAAGIGVYFLASAPSASHAALTPWISARPRASRMRRPGDRAKATLTRRRPRPHPRRSPHRPGHLRRSRPRMRRMGVRPRPGDTSCRRRSRSTASSRSTLMIPGSVVMSPSSRFSVSEAFEKFSEPMKRFAPLVP